MNRSKHGVRRSLIAAAWTLIWFGTILVANPKRALVDVGIALWGCGLLLQYGIAFRHFAGLSPNAAQARPRSRSRRIL